MPGAGKRFTAKGDRMARHVASSYGGGRAGLSIGYAVATLRGERLSGKGGRRVSAKNKRGGKKR